MKMPAALSDLPELRELDDVERAKVIRQWLRAADETWSGYLLHFGLCLLVALLIGFLPEIVLRMFRGLPAPKWAFAVSGVIGLMVANMLYARFTLRRRRDLLQRVLEERRRAL